MRNSARIVILFISVFFISGRCEPEEGWTAAGPVTQNIAGEWKLAKVITPTHTLSGSQIRYTELLKNTYDDGLMYERLYRNDTLVVTHIQLKDPLPVAKTAEMSVLMFYQGGLQRMFKFKHEPPALEYIMEASDYVTEVGSAADSVRYIYVRNL